MRHPDPLGPLDVTLSALVATGVLELEVAERVMGLLGNQIPPSTIAECVEEIRSAMSEKN